MALSEVEFMRRRAFIRGSLAAAHLAVAPGVLDSTARLVPITLPISGVKGMVAELESITHDRAMEFPTTPAVDLMPALLRDYAGSRALAAEARATYLPHVYGCMSYLTAFVAANLADQQNYKAAYEWYGVALLHAEQAGDREAKGWIAGRAALIPWYRHDVRQTIHDAAYAAVHSPDGQLGTTLGNALAASALARVGDRRNALKALDDSERATERSDERFTAYSFPPYRWHKFASDVHTQLGDTRRALYHQEQALAGYPLGAVTDPTFVKLDQAHCMATDSPREGARHATRTVLSLTPERALPALLHRADEVADVIGGAGRSEAEELRHVVRHTRVVAA